MKFGDELVGDINAFDEKGRGIFTYKLEQSDEMRTVAVPFCISGDRVSTIFRKRNKGIWEARLQTILKPSHDRVMAPCPLAGSCGGCLWQQMAYDAQIQTKKKMIDHAFEKAGHSERVDSVLACSSIFYYRNRMDFAVGPNGETGLKEYGSWNRYLDCETCLLLDQDTPKILEIVRDIAKKYNIEPWNARTHTGLLRYVVIRTGKNTGERMIIILVHDLARVNERVRKEFVERLTSFATTLYLGENPEITDLSRAKTLELLHGNNFLFEEVNGIRYGIHPNSFFQTNTIMAEKLQETVARLARGSSAILDLYCGVGFFGIACAKAGSIVYGYEIDMQAIEMAKQNAELNGVSNQITFATGSVEQIIESLLTEKKAETIILDPPRAGLHPRVTESLLKYKPKNIIYVSCNYHRFVDELSKLKSAYRMDHLSAYDLFPHTPHVEIISKLSLVH